MCKFLLVCTFTISYLWCYSQARLVLNNDAYLVFNNSVFVVLDNSDSNALTQIGSGGRIVSESENNKLRWNIGSFIGTYVIPFYDNDNYPTQSVTNEIPLTLTILSGGTTGPGNRIDFSTYDGGADNSTYFPNGVTNMNSLPSITNSSLNVNDRFWLIDANHTIKPTVNLTFSYIDNENSAPNTITETNLKAQRWNSSANNWGECLYPPNGVVNTSANTVHLSGISAAAFYNVWSLIDLTYSFPVANVGNISSLCSGSNTSVGGSVGGAATGGVWSGGLGTWFNASNLSAAAYNPSPLENGNISLFLITTGAPCPDTATTVISIIASPVADSGPSINSAVTCGKNIIQLAAPALANGISGAWTSTPIAVATAPGVAIPPNSNVSDFQGVYGGSYLVSWTVTQTSTGCTGIDTMVVIFRQPNAPANLFNNLIGANDVLWNGLTSSDWSTSNNWYQRQAAGHYVRMVTGQPTASTEVFTLAGSAGDICIGNNMPTLSATSNAEDVYVNTNMTLNLTNDIINIVGNLTNHGTINASIGTINFTGGQASTISGNGTTSLYNMTVNKTVPHSLTVSMPVTVTGTLDMTLGNILTSPNSLLTLGSSSAIPGTLAYTAGNIVGPLRRYFINGATTGNAGLFPVGTTVHNRYAKVDFTSTPGVDQNLTVWYKSGAPLTPAHVPLYNGLPLTTQDNQLIQNYSADGYWNVDPTGDSYTSSITSAPYAMTLWANNLSGMVTPSITRIIKAPGSNTVQNHHVQWQGAGIHTAIAVGTTQPYAITSTNNQGFSWFNVGSSNNQALPVELLSFSGSCAGDQVDLTWQTASEHNSLNFEVEKSRDGDVWTLINTQASAGNSTQLLTYTYFDKMAAEGNNYYRLTQYDIDGASKVYDVINVNCSGSSKGYFSTYPNPTSGAFQVVLNNKDMLGTSVLNIRDTKGSSILHRTIDVKAGINLFSVQDLQLAPGIYYISVSNGDKTTEIIKQSIR